ncbi:MAG: hypothetical protein R3F59_01905 [Myxococcota bacterium]
MEALTAVQCRGCGGTVRLAAGERVPTCLFCGADAADLQPAAPPEGVEPPEGALPFAVDHDAAQAAFVQFARSSFWYPSDLRAARLVLRGLLLPAWAWSGEVETHWTGLVSDRSCSSGKRPVAGANAARYDQVLIPASRTLRMRELAALGRYDEGALGPYDAEAGDVAVELSELTRSAARARAHAEMEARHQRSIAQGEGLTAIRASALTTAGGEARAGAPTGTGGGRTACW